MDVSATRKHKTGPDYAIGRSKVRGFLDVVGREDSFKEVTLLEKRSN